MYEMAIDQLAAAAFDHYEVSNFAQAGFRCRHNEAYWTGRPYFAAGPGAARYVAGRRETNHRSTTHYLRQVLAGQSPVFESEFLSPVEAAKEKLVFELRRLEGVDRLQFAAETGFELSSLVPGVVERYVEQGWLAESGSRLRLTRDGLMISDSLWPDMLG
jgi:oxygen-independent coproporphyrinogen-3 oxidase